MARFAAGGAFLSVCAFGFNNCVSELGGFGHFLALCLTPDRFALIAFAGLGVLGAVMAFWLWDQITTRHSYERIGAVIAASGLALCLLAGASSARSNERPGIVA